MVPQSRQRTHVNTTCKLLLLSHAFDTLGCKVVGLRTDNFNFRSQRAIEGLGARKDGVIRHHAARRDGSVRDSVLYSILAGEWPDVRRHLELRLARHESDSGAGSVGTRPSYLARLRTTGGLKRARPSSRRVVETPDRRAADLPYTALV